MTHSAKQDIMKPSRLETLRSLGLAARRRYDLMTAPLRAGLRFILGRPALPCSWCLREAGRRPRMGDSHGICERHMAQMRAEALEITRRQTELAVVL